MRRVQIVKDWSTIDCSNLKYKMDMFELELVTIDRKVLTYSSYNRECSAKNRIDYFDLFVYSMILWLKREYSLSLLDLMKKDARWLVAINWVLQNLIQYYSHVNRKMSRRCFFPELLSLTMTPVFNPNRMISINFLIEI